MIALLKILLGSVLMITCMLRLGCTTVSLCLGMPRIVSSGLKLLTWNSDRPGRTRPFLPISCSETILLTGVATLAHDSLSPVRLHVVCRAERLVWTRLNVLASTSPCEHRLLVWSKPPLSCPRPVLVWVSLSCVCLVLRWVSIRLVPISWFLLASSLSRMLSAPVVIRVLCVGLRVVALAQSVMTVLCAVIVILIGILVLLVVVSLLEGPLL